MYKLEHLNTTTAQGLPLYPIRLSPMGHYKASYLLNWSTTHNVFVAHSGTHLYFNSEADATLFILGHNYG